MKDSDDRWARVESLFIEALESSPEERAALFERLNREDPSLAAEVRDLLDAHGEPGFVDALAEGSASATAGVQIADAQHEPGTRFGPYEVDVVLGQGGMGVVYRAHRADGQFRQEVALKVLPAELLSRRTHERFLAEREILARMSHPNVARLLDGGVDEAGRPYFAMELVDGQSILAYCDARNASLRDRVELFITICEAVQHAHQNLVVHRDLKPGNILVTEDGSPKLLDFGIGKLLDTSGEFATETQVGVRLLTPAYAAPEQLRGAPANTASDIYQLGILLFELLTGAHPFPERRSGRADPEEWERSALDPTRPSDAATSADSKTVTERARARAATRESLGRGLRGDLDAIVLKAMRPSPTDRYASATELADDLRRFLEHRPVRARRDSWGYRSRLFLRRNRSAIAVAAAGVVGILAFTAGIARESRQTALERDRAQAVSDFMTELFANADPFRVNRSEMAVRDVLDEGLERLRADEVTDRRVRASMLVSIGQAYEGLGLTEEALAAASEALRLLRAEEEVPDLRLADVTAEVASLMTTLGRFQEAVPLMSEADSLLTRLDPSSDTLLRALIHGSLGASWLRAGEPARATPYLEEAVALYLSLEDGWEGAAGAMGDLAVIRKDLGDTEGAEALYRQELALREQGWGPDHLWVTNSLDPLGSFLLETGRLDEAEDIFLRSLRILTAGLPPDHHLLSGPWVGLARVAAARGETDRADSLFERALSNTRAGYGERHFAVGRLLNQRGIYLQQTGRWPDAEADYRAGLEILTDQYGREHPYTAVVAVNLAWAAAVNGKSQEAAERYAEVLPILRGQTPDDSTVYGHFTDYGIILCLQGDAAAEAPLRTAVAELSRIAPGSDRDLRARNALASCLVGLGRPQEAIPLFESVLADTEGRPDDDPARAFARADLERIRAAEGSSGRQER